MKTYLVLTHGKSHKFWQIEVSGKTLSLRYGKAGAQGQSRTKTFESEVLAREDAAKRVKAKLKQGYREDTGESPTTVSYAHLLDASDLHAALIEHFAYLANTPGFEPILAQIMTRAHRISLEDENLEVHFEGGKTLSASPPSSNYATWPESFRALMAHHAHLSFPDDGWALYLGDTGLFEGRYLEEVESTLLDHLEDADDVLNPITDYSDWVLYHPQRRNPQGNPALCHFSHEGGDVQDPLPYDAGAYFLLRMARILGLEVRVPEIRAEEDAGHDAWYAGLCDAWRDALRGQIDNEENDSEAIGKLLRGDRLVLENAAIDDLSPLAAFEGLEYLSLTALPLTSLKSLPPLSRLSDLMLRETRLESLADAPDLPALERLKVLSSPLRSLEGVERFAHLEDVNVSATAISSLDGIEWLETLEVLDISHTAIEDLTPLRDLGRLRALRCDDTGVGDIRVVLGNKEMVTLQCSGTRIPFAQLLEFATMGREDPEEVRQSVWYVTLWDDYNEDMERFLEGMRSLGTMDAAQAVVLAYWTHQHVLDALKEEAYELARDLLEGFMVVDAEALTPKMRDELAVQALIVATKIRDVRFSAQVFSRLIPQEVTDRRLAFNLARYFSAMGNKQRLIEYTRLARVLGEETEAFREEGFERFSEDEVFVWLCRTPQGHDPHAEPQAWWDSLAEELQAQFLGAVGKRDTVARVLALESLSLRDAQSLEPLRYLRNLKTLKVFHNRFASLDPLRELDGLEVLEIEGEFRGRITDVSPLAGLKRLRSLSLCRQGIKDLGPLRGLKALETLELMRNPVASIAPLSDLGKLTKLTLSEATLEDISPLTSMAGLKRLMIRSSGLRDYSPVSALRALEQLWIGNHVSSMQPFEALEDLFYICVTGQVSIDAFQKAHPDCDVNKL